MHLKKELDRRGFLNQYTSDELFDLYNKGENVLYVGMDPTADSLHLGNFVGFMHAVQYMKRGNKLIFIVGGATGMIGDPGGKNSERTFLDKKTLAENVKKIEQQVSTLFENLRMISGETFDYEVRNNMEFYQELAYIDFLREVGKYVTVNQMMNKETVKRRIEDPDQSISYTEFSYMLMQAFDFLKLYENDTCKLQIAGSDQRGNLVTGIELVRKKLDQEVYGVTSPLVLDSSGKKFGKSEGNALWLDPQKNAPFVIYQYFMNTNDQDIERYLQLFTLLEFEKIEEILKTHQKDESKRRGQEQLAYHVTMTIFGEAAADNAKLITATLFSEEDPTKEIMQMSADQLTAFHQATGSGTIDSLPERAITIMTDIGLTSSNGEAKKMIKSSAVYLNEQPLRDVGFEITTENLLNKNYFLLRKGKKNYALVRVEKK